MGKVSISQAWTETREIMGREGKLLFTVAAALFLLPQVLATLLTGQTADAQPADASTWSLLLMAIGAIIGLIGQLAVARLAAGPAASVQEAIGHALKRTLPLLGALLLLILALSIIFAIAALVLAALGMIDLQTGRPQGSGVAILVAVMLIPMFYLAVRLLPMSPVAALEQGGPVSILRRSWDLTSGQWLRLAGFVLLFVIGALILMAFVGLVAGLITATLFGEVEPMSLGALIVALLTGIAQALVTLVYIVMLTRIYVQLAGAGRDQLLEPSVPSSGT